MKACLLTQLGLRLGRTKELGVNSGCSSDISRPRGGLSTRWLLHGGFSGGPSSYMAARGSDGMGRDMGTQRAERDQEPGGHCITLNGPALEAV